MEADVNASGMTRQEFEAGPDHTIVIYQPADMGVELDPAFIFGAIAEDATSRASSGVRILSMTTIPLRHAGAWMGQEGSGYQTKVAVAVVYEHWRGVTA